MITVTRGAADEPDVVKVRKGIALVDQGDTDLEADQ